MEESLPSLSLENKCFQKYFLMFGEVKHKKIKLTDMIYKNLQNFIKIRMVF